MSTLEGDELDEYLGSFMLDDEDFDLLGTGSERGLSSPTPSLAEPHVAEFERQILRGVGGETAAATYQDVPKGSVLPKDDIRRSYMKIFVEEYNSGDFASLQKSMAKILRSDCYMIQRCIGEKKCPNYPSAVDIYGADSIFEYWKRTTLWYPDVVLMFHETKFILHSKTSRIQSRYSSTGTKIFQTDFLNKNSTALESVGEKEMVPVPNEIGKSASATSTSVLPSALPMSVGPSSAATSTSSRTAVHKVNDSSWLFVEPKGSNRKRKAKEVDDVSGAPVTAAASAPVNSAYAAAVPRFSHYGTFTLYLDPDHLVWKMEFLFVMKEA